MRPRSSTGLGENIYKLKNLHKATCYVPGDVKGMSTPIASKRSEEREFVVDSGASKHMMSKKELSSEELWRVTRSRTPNVVSTENGEVHTHEEAQVFVHDLNQFVTVQLLEETRAVLSPGKLWKYHGYSHEWVSGQGPRMTKNGRILSARQTILYLLSFQGYLSIPTAVCLLLRHPKNRWDQRHLKPLQTERQLFFRCSIGAKELATRKLGQESLRSDKKDENDPLADLPFWLQDFKDDLIPTEVQAPAHISQDSDSEHSTKVAAKSRNHRIFSRSRKTQIPTSA